MIFLMLKLLCITCILNCSITAMHVSTGEQYAIETSSPLHPSSSATLPRGFVHKDQLVAAILDNNLQNFKDVLSKSKLSHDYESKQSPLYTAIKLKRTDFIKLLLDHEAIITLDALKILIQNPTYDNYEIFEILAPYIKKQKLNTSEIIPLFNDPYDMLEKMLLIVDPDANSTHTPRSIQNENHIPRRYFALATVIGLLASYFYFAHNETKTNAK